MSDSKNSGKLRKKQQETRAAVSAFVITNLQKNGSPRLPVLPFRRMKERVLGRHYALSLVVAGDALARRLNLAYRRKNYIPNVLAFPLNRREGEIVLNIREAKRECGARRESLRYFVALLFVHALLHLKGLRHGRIMEHEERALLSLFHINDTSRSGGTD